MTFAPDGRLVTAGGDGTVRLWNVHSPQSDPIVLRGHEGWIGALALAPDGHLASAGEDGTVRVWDVGSPQSDPVVLRSRSARILALAFGGDGRLVTGGDDGDGARVGPEIAPRRAHCSARPRWPSSRWRSRPTAAWSPGGKMAPRDCGT